MKHRHWNEEEKNHSPCSNCPHVKVCNSEQLLCSDFITFVKGGVSGKHHRPSHKAYLRFLSASS